MSNDISETELETQICNLHLESGWLPGNHQGYDTVDCVEKAHLPVLTGRDERGRTTWCGALRDPVSYRPDRLPIDQGRPTPPRNPRRL